MINTSLMVRSLHISGIIFIICILFFDTTYAQFDQPGNDKSMFRGVSGVTMGVIHQQWTLQDSGTISQQSAPLSVSVPLGDRFLLSVTNSGVMTKFDTTEVSSLVDTRLSLSYVLPGDKIWLTGGVSIPTGKTNLNASQLTVASFISQTAFAYHVPTFGQGFNGNLALVYAGTITRRMVVGIGASYYFKGKYEPIEAVQKIEYDAGDELSVNLGYDFITYSKAARISLDLTATYFLKDKITDNSGTRTIFQLGQRVIGLLAYSLRTENLNHLAQLRVRYRLPSTSYSTDTTEYNASTQFEGQYSLSYPVNEWLLGSAIVELKSYTPEQTLVSGIVVETGKAQITSFGFDATFLFSEIIVPTFSFRYSTGEITLEANNAIGKSKVHDVSGLLVGLGIRVSF